MPPNDQSPRYRKRSHLSEKDGGKGTKLRVKIEGLVAKFTQKRM